MKTHLQSILFLCLKFQGGKSVKPSKIGLQTGFTLIELLVVIIIVGILAAIALPNFLNQAVKARQSEAKQTIALVNRAQARYRNEYSVFATTFNQLAVGAGLLGNTTATTSNYNYILGTGSDPQAQSTVLATARDTAAHSYTGGSLKYTNSLKESVITSTICETNIPTTVTPLIVIFTSGTKVDCPDASYHELDDTKWGG